MKKVRYKFILLVLFTLLANGCSLLKSPRAAIANTSPTTGYLEGDGPPDVKIDLDAIADAIPKAEPLSKYGNPEFYLVEGKTYNVMKESKGFHQKGTASWYGKRWHGLRTSSGEPYDLALMTAAHPTLPIPTYVKVKNLENNKEVVVKVNDRGPFKHERIIDLSYAAAAKLGILAKGSAEVFIEAIDTGLKELPAMIPVFANNTNKKYLQLGSFSYRENATALMKEIEQLTQTPVLIKAIMVENRPFYQVKLGPLAENEDVSSLIQNIKNAGLGQPLLTDHA